MGWVKVFGLKLFPDQSAHACQIWLQSDGRVEKKRGGVQTDTHAKGHCSIIVDGNAIVMDFWSRTQCEVTV